MALTTIPAGTRLVWRMLNTVDSRTRGGASIRAALAEPLQISGAPAGAADAVLTFLSGAGLGLYGAGSHVASGDS